ncbi:MAG: hypothetical protein Q7S33_05250 [Nanoarchaeota archaeon]|nr:hypothetical protein [Nanoarchaeota archaeon]
MEKEENSSKPYSISINGNNYFIKSYKTQIDIEGPGVKTILYRSISSREADIIVKDSNLESLLALILYFNKDKIPLRT